MIVHGDRQHTLGAFLADHILIQFVLQGARRRDFALQRMRLVSPAFLQVENRLANFHAGAADIDIARPFN